MVIVQHGIIKGNIMVLFIRNFIEDYEERKCEVSHKQIVIDYLIRKGICHKDGILKQEYRF